MISVSYSAMADILEQEIISNSSCKPNCVAWHYDVKAGPWSLLWAGHMTQNGLQSKVLILSSCFTTSTLFLFSIYSNSASCEE